MNWKILAGAGTLSLLMALAALIGSVALHSAAADTLSNPPAGAAAQAATTPAPATSPPATKQARPNGGFWGGAPGRGGAPGMGGPGMGGPGMGGPGMGGPGFGRGGKGDGATIANGTSRVITATASLITLVKGDLTYATGKMDTTTVADWVSRAEALLTTAQSAATAGQTGQAVATASAAGSLARAADLLMQQALGADKLPSYNQNPRGGFLGPAHRGTGPATPATPTQAQASREMASFYNEIIRTAALLKAAPNAGDAASYLTAAQNRYSAAYTAYQAGTYADAHASVEVGRLLLQVTDSLLRAATAPAGTDTPVQVPAPNF